MTEQAKKLGCEPATGYSFQGGVCNGLTKREYFSGLVMQAIISNPDIDKWSESYIAEYALKNVNALLEELSKTK